MQDHERPRWDRAGGIREETARWIEHQEKASRGPVPRRVGIGEGQLVRLLEEGLLHQRLLGRQPGRDAAGDQIVQLPRRHRLVLGAEPHPQPRPVGAADDAVHMHALRDHAETRQRAAIQHPQHRPGAGDANIKKLVPDAEEAALRQAGQGFRQRLAAHARPAQPRGQSNTARVKVEIARPEHQRLGKLRPHPANLRLPDPERDQPRRRGEVVAGVDMAREGRHRPL